MYTYDPSMLDEEESGCDQWNCKQKIVRGTWYLAIPVMSLEGIHDLHLAEGNVETHLKHLYETASYQFYMVRSSVMILDNASIHHVDAISDIIVNQVGVHLLFLSPYSPDPNQGTSYICTCICHDNKERWSFLHCSFQILLIFIFKLYA